MLYLRDHQFTIWESRNRFGAPRCAGMEIGRCRVNKKNAGDAKPRTVEDVD